MEKKNGIFDVNLDSLLDSQPIEVDGAEEGMYPHTDIIPQKIDKEADAKAAAEKNELEKGLIDLNIGKEEEEDDEDGDGSKDISEEPSSSETSPQVRQKSKTSSPLTPYAKLLVDEGVLPNLDLSAFDGSAESLKEAMIEEILGAVDMYKDSLPPRIKAFINNYEDGVPLDKLVQFDKTETEIDSLTAEKLEDDASLQKKVVGDYLRKTTKFSDSRINRMVEGYEDSGELEEEAKSSLVELKTMIASEKAEELKQIQYNRKVEEDTRKRDLTVLEDRIRTTKEIIPGLQVSDKVKKNMFASMTQPVGYDQHGRPVNRIVAARMDNPVEFEMKLHYLFEITKGFTDFNKIAEKGRKDASKQFEEAVSSLDNQHTEETESNAKPLARKSLDFLKGLEKTYKL